MSTFARNDRSQNQARSQLDKNIDVGFIWLTRICAIAIAGVLLWITFQVAVQALPAIQQFGLGFLGKSIWNPVKNEYGVLPQIYGTLVSAFLGLLISIPIGVGTAVLLSERLLPKAVEICVSFFGRASCRYS